jgi:hypothetical protein
LPELARSKTASTSTFPGLFLGPGDLPPEMRCVRDARDADMVPPGDDANRHGWKRAGWASWFGPADADLYRVDDVRWLFGSERPAERRYAEIAARAGASAREVDPVVEAGLQTCAFGTPGREYVHLIAGGVIVARIRAVAGEGATLSNERVLDLARVAAARLLFHLAAGRAEPEPTWWARK